MSLLAACCLAATLEARAIEAHMRFLADDLLEGRGTATRGYELAARYIASQFELLGLETTLQQVPMRRAELDVAASSLVLTRANGEKMTLVHGRDYTMRPDVRGTSEVEASVVFPEEEVAGKIVAYTTVAQAEDALTRGAIGLLGLTTPTSWYVDAGPAFATKEPRYRASVTLAPSITAEMLRGATARIVNRSRVSEVQSPNVIATLRGERADEYVVLSAHADHLGIGEAVNGDAIYNGAVDNASGVAALLEIARMFAQSKPYRSVMFIAFTAEEPGLVGSDYFVANAAETIVANVNIDGASVWPYDTLTLRGTRTPLFARAIEASGVTVVPDPFPERFSGSDQYSFAKRNIQAVLFAATRSGEARALALDWVRTRYHQPGDDLSQPLDFEATARFTREVFRVVDALVNVR